MNARAYNFLAGVLGADGAQAFRKAMEKEGQLSTAVVPRAILSWIGLATQYNYEGGIPGVENTYLSFKKTEGPGYTGAVSIGEDVYSFRNASMFHVAGAVAVALGLDQTRLDPGIRDMTVTRLGKSIDTLVKARVAIDELAKRKTKKAGDVAKPVGDEQKKVELPGATNKPKEQQMAMPPAAPQFQQAQPKPPPKSALKITKSQTTRKCSMCARHQFQGMKFTGCLCFRDLAKSVRVTETPVGLTLEFRSPEWDQDAIEALNAALRGR